jgi:tetratricopeptide (TPR) repeat protein
MTAARFDLERLRFEAAQALPAPCFEDFQRLTRTLIHGPPFQWLLIDTPDDRLRKAVIAQLDPVLRAAGLRVNRVPLGRAVTDVATLEQRLVRAAQSAEVVHLLGARGWFDATRWDAFNVRRERIAETARARLVFWLEPQAIALAAQGAPDLWAWRSGVYVFRGLAPAQAVSAADAPPAARLAPAPAGPDNRTMAERHRRVAEIKAWLKANPKAPDAMKVGPLDELGRLLYDLGDFDAALKHWRRAELPLHRRLRNAREVAITFGQIADVLRARGELDEALRIRREEQLPVYERLGDDRARAVTMGKIADVLQARGQLDEALRIRREDELPVFERWGDQREHAVTMGKVADVLESRGELDEALRIRREEELPVYERLGDQRGRALTMGRIADVLQDRGELDEALRIRREEELPVYERLGDQRSRAVTMGKMADVLQARGELDEALRIRREEELPVYERLGDQRSRAVTMGKIADVLQARGELDEALRIRREEEVPVYERVGDQRELGVAEWKLGLADWEAGRQQPAADLLRKAYARLSAMRLPEAARLLAHMTELGIKPE